MYKLWPAPTMSAASVESMYEQVEFVRASLYCLQWFVYHGVFSYETRTPECFKCGLCEFAIPFGRQKLNINGISKFRGKLNSGLSIFFALIGLFILTVVFYFSYYASNSSSILCRGESILRQNMAKFKQIKQGKLKMNGGPSVDGWNPIWDTSIPASLVRNVFRFWSTWLHRVSCQALRLGWRSSGIN